MSDTYNYEVLEPGGHARLVGNVLDRISEASANPASAVGSSRALLGDAETASWMERTTAADGAALIESVKGNTLRWNQLVYNPDFSEASDGGAAGFSVSGVSSQTYANGVATIVTSGNYAGFGTSTTRRFPVTAGHKYLFAIDAKSSAGNSLSMFINSDNDAAHRFCTGYVSMTADAWVSVRRIGECPVTTSIGTFLVQDQTGANGHTLQFRNPQLFDLTAMFGAGNEPATVAEFEALFPLPYYPYDPGSLLPVRMEGVETVAADESWSSQRTIPAATYFPDGLRSAGSVRDELTSHEAIHRVCEADLGTLTWTKGNALTDGTGTVFHAGLGTKAPSRTVPDCECAELNPVKFASPYEGITKGDVFVTGANVVVGGDSSLSAAEFKASMNGVILYAQWATPTTTPIDPPLPMSYRVGAGGTERVMVASGTTSAPPIFVTRYPLDPADLAASIAPVDGPIAKTNHQVGDLLMLGFTLCKATQVIVTGETIAIGTNVTRTSVAAELAALSE